MLVSAARADLRTDVVYGEASGEKLLLDAFTPAGTGPFPICILVHGGGWVRGDKHNNFRTLLGPLGEAGFAWFSINYRLAPKHRYPACVEDVEAAIRWVKARAADYKGDPRRIALIGESAGGHLVSLVGVRAKADTRVAAVVAFYAPTDLALQASVSLRTPAWATALFGITAMDHTARKTIREASPISHVGEGLPPFLLVHGSADERVAVSQSRQFQARLKSAGNACDLFLVEGAGHGLVHWDRVDASYKDKLIAWLIRASPARVSDDLPLDAVKWTGGFWQDRMQRLRDIHLPGVLDGSFMSVENGSTFLNLLRAARLEEGGAQGSTWSDGDCYLVLDTVARLQAYQPDGYLKSKLDQWIPIIARVQLADGLVDSWTVLGEFDATHGKPWRWQMNKMRGEGFHGALHYNTGSLYAFASTLQRATGDGRALAIADKAVRGFMAAQKNSVAGPMQWAVPHLYARTGDAGLLDVLRRASSGPTSAFGPPVRHAQEIFGHNTQAAHTLLRETAFCGMTCDDELLNALRRLAENQLTKKTFITGAVAPVFRGRRPEQLVGGKTYPAADYEEAVGPAYELPNGSCYCESCGQCLFAEWYYRMFRLTGEAVYMDAVERALYNAVPGCADLDRPNFFYCNPQEQLSGSQRSHTDGTESKWEAHYTWRRQFTKKAACCPPKVMRALAMSAEMAYSASREGLWVNLYGQNQIRVALPAGGGLECRQASAYPWDGKVRLVLQEVESAKPFGIFLRIPGWVNGPVRIAVNGEAVPGAPPQGTYHALQRNWKSGDVVEMEIPMPVRYMAAHPAVADARGKVAVMRGPIVYCVEGDDVPADIALEHVRVPARAELKPEFTKELGGVMKLTGTLMCSTGAPAAGDRLIPDDAETALYREARFAPGAPTLSRGDRPIPVSMIPYYARLNRKSDYFRIWLPVY